MTSTPPTLKETLMSRVRAGELAMKPRLYFSLQVGVLGVIIAGILLTSIFIFNFCFFSIRLSGYEQLLGFGTRGIGRFLFFFPWHLLFLDVLLVGVLHVLLRRFRFGYRVPILYLLAGLFAAALLAGFLLDRGTSFNDRMRAHRALLPAPLHRFYGEERTKIPRGSGICRCEIVSIEGNVITVLDTREATTTLTVIVPENDRRATTSRLSVGDVVFIAGEEKDGVVHAFGIKKDRRPGR